VAFIADVPLRVADRGARRAARTAHRETDDDQTAPKEYLSAAYYGLMATFPSGRRLGANQSSKKVIA
jgi:hypothetical protein